MALVSRTVGRSGPPAMVMVVATVMATANARLITQCRMASVSRTGAIRIELKPFCDWPAELRTKDETRWLATNFAELQDLLR